LGTKNDARYNLKIIDNGTGPVRDDTAAKPAKKTDERPAPAKDEAEAEAPTEAADQPAEESPAEEEQASDRLQRARAELADLDDLDV